MRKTEVALMGILIVLASAIFGAPLFRASLANPIGIWSPPELAILSPSKNGTYRSNVPLTINVLLFAKGYSPEMLTNLSYCLNGKPDINLPFHSDYGGPKTTIVVSDVLFGLNDGKHVVIVHGLTDWSNTLDSNITFSVDTQISPIVVVSPQNEAYNVSYVPLAFTIDKSFSLDESTSVDGSVPKFQKVSWVQYSLDGQNNLTIHGNATLTGLSNGGHNITVYAKDIYGNICASQTTFFTTKMEEPFLSTFVIAVTGASIAVVATTLLFYFKKRKDRQYRG